LAFWRVPVRIFRGVVCWAASAGNLSSVEEEELPCLVTSSFRVYDGKLLSVNAGSIGECRRYYVV
jgi:hypothetical protein